MIPGYEMLDLSLLLGEELPCSWPGDAPFRHELANWFANEDGHESHGPYYTRSLQMNEHAGTHFDAPVHFIPAPGSGLPGAGPQGMITSDRVPLEQLTGPAVVLDATGLAPAADGCSPEIGTDTVEAFEREHGVIAPGDVVLLRTGWDSHYVAGDRGRRYIANGAWPAPTPDLIALLLRRGTRCIGIDTPSVGAAEDGHPTHVAGLAEGLVFVEGLARLERLPPRGALFLFLPLSLLGGTGAPGRAVALLESDT